MITSKMNHYKKQITKNGKSNRKRKNALEDR